MNHQVAQYLYDSTSIFETPIFFNSPGSSDNVGFSHYSMSIAASVIVLHKTYSTLKTTGQMEANSRIVPLVHLIKI